MVYCLYSFESPRLGSSNENTVYLHVEENRRDIPIMPPSPTWLYNKPSMARTTPVRTNFHSPKGVRAIEVQL